MSSYSLTIFSPPAPVVAAGRAAAAVTTSSTSALGVDRTEKTTSPIFASIFKSAGNSGVGITTEYGVLPFNPFIERIYALQPPPYIPLSNLIHVTFSFTAQEKELLLAIFSNSNYGHRLDLLTHFTYDLFCRYNEIAQSIGPIDTSFNEDGFFNVFLNVISALLEYQTALGLDNKEEIGRRRGYISKEVILLIQGFKSKIGEEHSRMLHLLIHQGLGDKIASLIKAVDAVRLRLDFLVKWLNNDQYCKLLCAGDLRVLSHYLPALAPLCEGNSSAVSQLSQVLYFLEGILKVTQGSRGEKALALLSSANLGAAFREFVEAEEPLKAMLLLRSRVFAFFTLMQEKWPTLDTPSTLPLYICRLIKVNFNVVEYLVLSHRFPDYRPSTSIKNRLMYNIAILLRPEGPPFEPILPPTPLTTKMEVEWQKVLSILQEEVVKMTSSILPDFPYEEVNRSRLFIEEFNFLRRFLPIFDHLPSLNPALEMIKSFYLNKVKLFLSAMPSEEVRIRKGEWLNFFSANYLITPAIGILAMIGIDTKMFFELDTSDAVFMENFPEVLADLLIIDDDVESLINICIVEEERAPLSASSITSIAVSSQASRTPSLLSGRTAATSSSSSPSTSSSSSPVSRQTAAPAPAKVATASARIETSGAVSADRAHTSIEAVISSSAEPREVATSSAASTAASLLAGRTAATSSSSSPSISSSSSPVSSQTAAQVAIPDTRVGTSSVVNTGVVRAGELDLPSSAAAMATSFQVARTPAPLSRRAAAAPSSSSSSTSSSSSPAPAKVATPTSRVIASSISEEEERIRFRRGIKMRKLAQLLHRMKVSVASSGHGGSHRPVVSTGGKKLLSLPVGGVAHAHISPGVANKLARRLQQEGKDRKA